MPEYPWVKRTPEAASWSRFGVRMSGAPYDDEVGPAEVVTEDDQQVGLAGRSAAVGGLVLGLLVGIGRCPGRGQCAGAGCGAQQAAESASGEGGTRSHGESFPRVDPSWHIPIELLDNWWSRRKAGGGCRRRSRSFGSRCLKRTSMTCIIGSHGRDGWAANRSRTGRRACRRRTSSSSAAPGATTTTGVRPKPGSTASPSSVPRSRACRSTSSTCAPRHPMPYRSCSPTGGPAPSSSSSA